MTLGQQIDKLAAIREEKRVLAEKEKVLDAAYSDLEAAILTRLQDEGMDKVTGKKATASVSSTTVANVTDWDSFNAFVKKTGNFQLYQRRVSDPAFRELLEQKGEAAMAKVGLIPFTKIRLNLRAI